MPLNWNIEKARDYKAIAPGSPEWAVTNALIWASMAIGIGTITKTNTEEFYRRLALYESQEGPRLTRNGNPTPMTLEDVKRRIGLSTNASSLTKTEFKQKLARLANH